jgi:hypothetical protein
MTCESEHGSPAFGYRPFRIVCVDSAEGEARTNVLRSSGPGKMRYASRHFWPHPVAAAKTPELEASQKWLQTIT